MMVLRPVLKTRGKALEDAFFYRVDVELLTEISDELDREAQIDRLQQVSGITNRQLLEHIITIRGIEAPTFAALTLVPCVFVAWADGRVTDAERAAILDLARQKGVLENEPLTAKLLDSWLQHRPTQALWELWTEYARSLGAVLSAFWRKALAAELVEHARRIAKASGGVGGWGAISFAEHQVLRQIGATLLTANTDLQPPRMESA